MGLSKETLRLIREYEIVKNYTAKKFLKHAGYEVNEENLYLLTQYTNSTINFQQFPDSFVFDDNGKPLIENREEPAAFQEYMKRKKNKN